MSINIIVTSNNQETLNRFFETFIPTTSAYDITLHVFHTNLVLPDLKYIISHNVPVTEFGNKSYNPILNDLILSLGKQIWHDPSVYWGLFNDDIIFTEGWLESVMEALQYNDCVTPGYTTLKGKEDRKIFDKIVKKTANDKGYVKYSSGFCWLMRIHTFLRIGRLDEQFNWSCDDLDLHQRMLYQDIRNVTLKKVTVAHSIGTSRAKEKRRWHVESHHAKRRFYIKHGLVTYRVLKKDMLLHHKYFDDLKNDIQ